MRKYFIPILFVLCTVGLALSDENANIRDIKTLQQIKMDKTAFGVYTSIQAAKLARLVPYSSATNNVKLGSKFLKANYLQLNTAPTSVPTTEGALSWDSTHHTLTIQSDISTSSLQVGQEEWVHVLNNSGSTITDGQAVYIVSASSGYPTISLAQANSGNPGANVLGVATNNIANGAMGYVTVRGVVHNYNTTGFAAGNKLYLSAVTPGALTNSPPISPNYAIYCAVALDSTANGMIYVSTISPSEAILTGDTDNATLDPTGWVNNDSIAISYDSTARTVTLTGTLKYLWRGSVITLTSPWTSPAHSATTGQSYFLYTTDGINFSWSTTPWAFSDLMVAYVSYGATDKYALREMHGLMPWQAHQEFHQTTGTYRQSGGTLSGYVLGSTTAADRRPIVAATVVKDEDVQTTNATLTTSLYTKLYLTGTGTSTFTVDTAEIVPLSGSQPYWNQFTAGAWQQTLMLNNSYMNVWLVAVPATSDVGSQKYRYIWLQGQTNGNATTEAALTPSDLNLGQLTSLSTEFVFCAKVTLRYTGGNWTIDSVTNLTGTRNNATSAPAGVYLSTVTTDTTLSGLGTAASPLSVVSAPKLTTGRTIGMTGDVTWTSPSFDGSGNVTAAATVVSGSTSTAGKLQLTDSTSSTSTTTAATPNAVKSAYDLANAAAAAAQPTWTAPTLLNSWVNFGGSYETAGYMKDTLGFVHLKGLVKNGTVGATIYTLPAGYLPTENKIFSIVSNGLFGDLRIDTSGNVVLNAGNNSYVSMSGIVFKP